MTNDKNKNFDLEERTAKFGKDVKDIRYKIQKTRYKQISNSKIQYPMTKVTIKNKGY